MLLFMSRPFWGWLAFLHLLWIIGDGAFFVFLVLNWQVDKSKGRRGAWHEAWRMAHGVRHGVAACVVHGVWRMTHRVTASVAATLHSHQLLPRATGDVHARRWPLRASRLVEQP